MTRAVAPRLAAIFGRTRTTRQLSRDMMLGRRRLAGLAAKGTLQGHLAHALQVDLAAAEDRQIGDQVEITFGGNPQARQPPFPELITDEVRVPPVERQVENDQSL